VVVALGTSIGCPVHPVYENERVTGFIDRCRGWRYDAAGRVYQGQEALRNLTVPPYWIDGDGLILIGVNPPE